VDRPQAVLVHVRIDLRGGDVAVAEEFLDDAEVGAAADQVGGEAGRVWGETDLRRPLFLPYRSTSSHRATRSSGLPVRERRRASLPGPGLARDGASG